MPRGIKKTLLADIIAIMLQILNDPTQPDKLTISISFCQHHGWIIARTLSRHIR